MKLVSDFNDYYDSLCDESGMEYRRLRGDGYSRRQAFAILRSLTNEYFRIMPNALPTEIAMKVQAPETPVVIYTDERVHGGEGLLLATLEEALASYPDCWCSLFQPALVMIETGGIAERYVISHSYFTIGNRSWELMYRNLEPLTDGAWMSNTGAYEVTILRELPRSWYNDVLRMPVWSIDFNPICPDASSAPLPHAFDLNTAPRIEGTGLEDVLSANEAIELIELALHRYTALEHEADTEVTNG